MTRFNVFYDRDFILMAIAYLLILHTNDSFNMAEKTNKYMIMLINITINKYMIMLINITTNKYMIMLINITLVTKLFTRLKILVRGLFSKYVSMIV
jgi:hypothetical protein